MSLAEWLVAYPGLNPYSTGICSLRITVKVELEAIGIVS